MTEDKLLTVAKAVYDNLPFTNKQFNPDSVNECAKRLEILLKKEHMSVNWMDSVYQASIKLQPIYIDLNNDWQWNFLTMKSGTREDILAEIGKIDFNKIEVRDGRH